jgi:hypothetical protein
MASAIARTRAICSALTRPVEGTAFAIAKALPSTPSHSRRDKPGLNAAFVPENEGTETLEEVITAVFIIFTFRPKHFDVTNIWFRATSFQLQFVLPAIIKMNMRSGCHWQMECRRRKQDRAMCCVILTGLASRDIRCRAHVLVDHSSINRWAIRFLPLLESAFRKHKHAVGISWRMDETYIRVNAAWKYLYRAVDKEGQTVDRLSTAKRDAASYWAPRKTSASLARYGCLKLDVNFHDQDQSVCRPGARSQAQPAW